MHGMTGNNPANDPDKKPIKSRSKFVPNMSMYQTALFGYCTPFYGAEVVPDDKGFSIRVNTDVDTLSLKAPLMTPVKLNKDYFFAPLRAIMPKTADLIVTNPTVGDDINTDLYNCLISAVTIKNICGSGNPNDTSNWHGGFLARLNSISENATNVYTGAGDLASLKFFSAYIGSLLTFYRVSWMFLSDGSVAAQLGYNWARLFVGPSESYYDRPLSWDEYMERHFDFLKQNVSSFTIKLASGLSGYGSTIGAGVTYKTFTVSMDASSDRIRGAQGSYNVISFRYLLYLLQQGYIPVIVSGPVHTAAGAVTLATHMNGFTNDATDPAYARWYGARVAVYDNAAHTSEYNDNYGNPSVWSTYKNVPVYNLSRILAYQLACVQFYTNDSVDYVYNCDLWHENQLALAREALGSNPTYNLYFQLNGRYVSVDSVSANLMYMIMYNNLYNTFYNYPGIGGLKDLSTATFHCAPFYSDPDSSTSTHGNGKGCLCWMFYYSNVFGYVRSLRYRDYFAGSKVRPMAVGNVDVTVNSNTFSVVDVTKNIQRQRFLNQVNRVGRSLKEYTRGIFGTTPMPEPHDVVFLGSTTDVIGAEETQNTGAAQMSVSQSVTSKLRHESSKFAFEGDFNEFGVVIGLVNFEITRPYLDVADRPVFHRDRFDMFNPYMQTIGDQEVMGVEMDVQSSGSPFGYQLRYSEYKQRVDRAAGGFRSFLPGYAFTMDYYNYQPEDTPGTPTYPHISPDFIRAFPGEFDKFYLALTNDSPAGYFHFILRHDVQCSINRPMLAAPSIL